jgi:hypothetical protein
MNNGYDGSMMNGLQTVENWQSYFVSLSSHQPLPRPVD